jgi:D-serine deaminase-like pyridoxal phosphate-dependent protein
VNSEKGVPGDDPVGRSIFDGTFPFPTAVLMRAALESNIAAMAQFCAAEGVWLAPHGKTTMCPQIIGRQMAAGAWAVTVATAWQAAAVAEMGVRRILIANLVVDPGSLRLLDTLLARWPDLEVYSYVDSGAALDALRERPGLARLRVLLEIGFSGGRTGQRSDRDALELARRVAAGPQRLAGVAAYEGILAGDGIAGTLALVDSLLHRMVGLAREIHAAGLLPGAGPPPIVTVGGSAYFDRVVNVVPPALAGTPFRTVLRSGCYVTHDAGDYDRTSPFGRSPRGDHPHRLREALRVWAPVLSRPEPGLVLAGLGRRDASTDAGLPVPELRRDRTGAIRPIEPGASVTRVNDQHAYLSVPESSRLTVGDVIGFGISHPCTTFDKWRCIPIVDEDHTVVEVARTMF